MVILASAWFKKDFRVSKLKFDKFAAKYFNTVTNIGILRVPRDHAKLVCSAISNISEINKILVNIDILHVGGTIRLCQNAAIKYDKEMLDLDESDL